MPTIRKYYDILEGPSKSDVLRCFIGIIMGGRKKRHHLVFSVRAREAVILTEMVFTINALKWKGLFGRHWNFRGTTLDGSREVYGHYRTDKPPYTQKGWLELEETIKDDRPIFDNRANHT